VSEASASDASQRAPVRSVMAIPSFV